MNPVMWGIVTVAAAAIAWHAVTEHHLHLRVLRIFRPATQVPPTAHDAWWHSLPQRRRIGVQAGLIAGGLAAGIAYQTAPAAVMAVLGALAAAGVGLVVIRTVRGRRS